MQLALPEKPSIAALPFQNISNDPEPRLLCRRDGRGHHHWAVADQMVVRDRAQFKLRLQGDGGRCEAGRVELGVRYVLEGGLRKAGNRLRITAQLLEAETAAHLGSTDLTGRWRTSSFCRT